MGEQGNSNPNCLLLQPPHCSFSLLPQPSLFTNLLGGNKLMKLPQPHSGQSWAQVPWVGLHPPRGPSPLADSCLL